MREFHCHSRQRRLDAAAAAARCRRPPPPPAAAARRRRRCSAVTIKTVAQHNLQHQFFMHGMIEKIFGRRTKLMFDPGLFPPRPMSLVAFFA